MDEYGSGERCSVGIQISAERGIFQRGNQFLLLRRYLFYRYAEHQLFMHKFLRIFPLVMLKRRLCMDWKSTNFLCMFYFPQSKIEYRRSINSSAGNPSTRGNPGLKCTRTDAILKKFEFKMKFKFKKTLSGILRTSDLSKLVYSSGSATRGLYF
jgi:hypothetical protein